jgi:hypothetical protein
LQSTTDVTTIPNPAVSLLVYNTNASMTLGNGKGFYYWDGAKWSSVGGASSPCTAPATPGAITGTTSPCQKAAGVAYSISAVAGATSYTWTVPVGASVASGQGSTSITVNFGTNGGNVCVTASNAACSNGIPSCIPVILSAAPIPITDAATDVTSTSFSANWYTGGVGVTDYYLDVATDAAFTTFVTGYNNLYVYNLYLPYISYSTGKITYSVTGLTLPACTGTPSYYYRIRAGNSCGISGNSSAIAVYSATPIWTQTENVSAGTDQINAIALDATGVYVAGYYNVSGSDNAWRIQKRNLTTGTITWTQTANPSTGNDQITAIAVDATGIYVAGYDNGPGNFQWRIEKWDLNTGAVIWTQTENPSTANDYIYAITLDATGVYIAGVDRAPGNDEWRIEKRDLNTGAVIWTQTENPSVSSDKILAIALDATGIYVAGYDYVPGNDEWRIEKRDLNTGAVIWTQTENPSSFEDQINAITLDASGLYVAGYDRIPANEYEWRTEKRDLSTGAAIWINNKNSSTTDAQIRAMAVDASGVYVAGYDNGTGNFQWRIEKYCK